MEISYLPVYEYVLPLQPLGPVASSVPQTQFFQSAPSLVEPTKTLLWGKNFCWAYESIVSAFVTAVLISSQVIRAMAAPSMVQLVEEAASAMNELLEKAWAEDFIKSYSHSTSIDESRVTEQPLIVRRNELDWASIKAPWDLVDIIDIFTLSQPTGRLVP